MKADMINGSLERNFDGRSIKTMIQVNTSGEEGWYSYPVNDDMICSFYFIIFHKSLR